MAARQRARPRRPRHTFGALAPAIGEQVSPCLPQQASHCPAFVSRRRYSASGSLRAELRGGAHRFKNPFSRKGIRLLLARGTAVMWPQRNLPHADCHNAVTGWETVGFSPPQRHGSSETEVEQAACQAGPQSPHISATVGFGTSSGAAMTTLFHLIAQPTLHQIKNLFRNR